MNNGASTSYSRKDYERWISNASQGDIDDFTQILQLVLLGTVPMSVIYDLIQLFVSFLKKRENDTQSEKNIMITGLGSILCLEKLVGYEAFRGNRVYWDYLYQNWYRSVEYTQYILSKTFEEFSEDKVERYFRITASLMLYIVRGSENPAKIDNSSAQRLASYICFFYPDDEPAQPNEEIMSLLIVYLVEENIQQCMDDLLVTVERSRKPGDCTPVVETIQRKLVERMNRFISLPYPSERLNKWKLMTSQASFICLILGHPEHSICKALLEGGILTVLLKGARLCKRSSITQYGISNSRAFWVTSLLLSAISRCLRAQGEDALRKAIRHGLISIVVSMGQRYEDFPQFAMDSLKKTLCSLITVSIEGRLDEARTVALLGEKLDEIPYYELDGILKGELVSEEWASMISLFIHNTILLRLHSIPEKIARCDACLTRSARSSLKRCGKCLNALYCSQGCQKKAWKEQGHKRVCSRDRAQQQIPVRKFHPKTEMLRSIAFSQVIDYRLARHDIALDFRPLVNMYIVARDAETVNTQCRVCSRGCFLGSIIKAGLDFKFFRKILDTCYDHIEEEYGGKGTLCLIRKREGEEEEILGEHHFITFPLDLDDDRKLPMPVPAKNSTVKPEPLPSLVGILKEELNPRLDLKGFSLKNIDKAAMNIFLDNSALGRSARQYWTVWNRACSISIDRGAGYKNIQEEAL